MASEPLLKPRPQQASGILGLGILPVPHIPLIERVSRASDGAGNFASRVADRFSGQMVQQVANNAVGNGTFGNRIGDRLRSAGL